MLGSVTRPNGKVVTFKYDALGQRVEKAFNGRVHRYLWDGDVVLHEWEYAETDRPQAIVAENGEVSFDRPEPTDNLVTWVYDTDSYVPTAKLVGGKRYGIVSDCIGRPVQAYDEHGTLVWQADYDIYGNLFNLRGNRGFVPFRQLGQYEDEETGLYYNRFRYYDPSTGGYISQDPIRLLSGESNFYAYVRDTNNWADVFGLEELFRGMKQKNNVPLTGNSADKLGVRPNVDIEVIDGKVYPNSGGMSVNKSIDNIPSHRKPIEFGGTQKGSAMFKIESDNLGDNLRFKADKNGTHGVIEPSRPMSLAEYQESLGALQNKFKSVCPS